VIRFASWAPRALRSAAPAAALLALASCSLFTGSDDRRAPAQVAVVGGGAQRGPVGEALRDSVVVEVTDRRGRPVPGAEVEFAAPAGAGSLSPARATTGADGRARAGWTLGTRAGSWEATAASGGKTATVRATAEPGAAVAVALAADSAALRQGDSVRIALQARDAYGNAVGRGVAWSSSDPQVATVSDSGVVRGVGGGEVLVVAAAGGVADTARVRVQGAVAVSIIAPASDTVLSTPLDRVQLFVSGTVTAQGGVSRVTYSLDGGAEQAAATAPRSDGSTGFSTPIQPVAPGIHVYTVRAEDARGNRAVARRTVVVESPARSYSLAYLGTPGGGDSEGLDLNARGDVVGASRTASGETRAFLWRGGAPVDLGAGLDGASRATAVADDGTVVGTYEAGCTRSWVWRAGTRTTLEGCLAAVDVNDNGTVLFAERKLLRGGVLVDLQEAAGRALYAVFRVNSRDAVLVEVSGACGGGFCFFGAAPLSPPSYGSANLPDFPFGGWGADLNDRGDFLSNCAGGSGQSGRCSGQLTLAGGTTVRLMFAGPGAASERGSAAALNDARQVVGMTAPEPDGRPFLWEGGRAFRIEVRGGGWTVDRVVEINDAGQVLAHASNPATGQKGAVLLTPAP
jgi:probable HAF family extracellular repeat protein